MHASELIDRLKIAIEEHGDLQVFTDDDSGWDQDIKGIHFQEEVTYSKNTIYETTYPNRIIVGWFDEKDTE